MYTTVSGWKWNDQKCTSSFPYICETSDAGKSENISCCGTSFLELGILEKIVLPKRVVQSFI